jgi:hypothetical protein
MTGAAASALAMRLNPLAVSSSIEDRRGVEHAFVPSAAPLTARSIAAILTPRMAEYTDARRAAIAFGDP